MWRVAAFGRIVRVVVSLGTALFQVARGAGVDTEEREQAVAVAVVETETAARDAAENLGPFPGRGGEVKQTSRNPHASSLKRNNEHVSTTCNKKQALG